MKMHRHQSARFYRGVLQTADLCHPVIIPILQISPESKKLCRKRATRGFSSLVCTGDLNHFLLLFHVSFARVQMMNPLFYRDPGYSSSTSLSSRITCIPSVHRASSSSMTLAVSFSTSLGTNSSSRLMKSVKKGM